MNLNNNLTLQIDAPFISVEEYAKRTGQTNKAVVRQCQEGKLPIGERSSNRAPFMINMVQMFKRALAKEY